TDMKADAVMVGDRNNDILGAKNCQIESLGVRYGFAEPDELENAGADYIIDSVVEIVAAIEQM
ncbi:MAG: HAD hydrolase-like protein, partial [Eubacteriales bacterium]|nr:HAD hydrolase-like protein [Eubacteriales bacterium]